MSKQPDFVYYDEGPAGLALRVGTLEGYLSVCGEGAGTASRASRGHIWTGSQESARPTRARGTPVWPSAWTTTPKPTRTMFDLVTGEVKIGDEMFWHVGAHDRTLIAKVYHVTPTGRFKVGGYVCNPDGTVRGADRSYTGPYRVRRLTDDVRTEIEAKVHRQMKTSEIRHLLARATEKARKDDSTDLARESLAVALGVYINSNRSTPAP